jgi:hypothetical protein
MAKRAGYVYQRPGRASQQVTGAGIRQDPKVYSERGRTPEERAEGKLMLEARKKGWSVEPTELGSGDALYSRGESIDVEVSVKRGSISGTLVSRLREYKVGNEFDSRIRFDPRRGIPTPAQVRSAFERRKQRVQAGAERPERPRGHDRG